MQDVFPINLKLKKVQTERNGLKVKELASERFNYTSNPYSDSNSKISSFMDVNPLLTDEKSTFRNITARSNNAPTKIDVHSKVNNDEIQEYCDRISKMVNLMESSIDSNPFNE